MGRNRKKAGVGAVERAIYDIFGNVIGQEDENAAPAPVSDQPVILTGAELTRQLGDTSGFSPNVRKLFTDVESPIVTNDPRVQKNMRQLGLDDTNPEHRRIFRILFGLHEGTGKMEHPNPAILVNDDQEIIDADAAFSVGSRGKFAGVDRAANSTMRLAIIKGDNVIIENHTYVMTDPNEQMQGAGYAMLRMQAYAARRLNEITGRNVTIRTTALSRDARLDPNGIEWVGAHTWPKLGYDFDFNDPRVPSDLVESLRAAGFKSMRSSDLMSEVNADGERGYDVWPFIVDEILSIDGQLSMKGTMNVTNDNDRGLQVMQNYGRQKGIVKGGTTRNVGGVDGITLTGMDNDILRQLWQQI